MKSYVSMEHQICVICGAEFQTNSILLDKRLKDSMEPTTVTGYGLCPEHQKLHDEGYIALIAVDEALSTNKPKNNVIKGLNGIHRTGAVAHVRREVAKNIFNCALPEGPFMYCEPEVISMLEKMQAKN